LTPEVVAEDKLG
jgi:hypothetical protein